MRDEAELAVQPDALAAIALHAQAVRDPAALFTVVGEALRELGLACHIGELDPASGDLLIRYVSLPPASNAADARAGRPIIGLRLSPARIPAASRALETGQAVYRDALEDDIAAAVPWLPRPAVRQLIKVVGAHRLIVAPLRTGTVPLGLLVVMGPRLTPRDAGEIERLGAHVGEALAAARTLEAARRREEAALALGDLSMRVAAGVPSTALPGLAVHALRKPLGAAGAAVWLLDEERPEGAVLRLAAQEGVPEEAIATIDILPLAAERLVPRAIREGRTLAIWDEPGASGFEGTRQALAAGGFGLAIAAPLRAGARTLGTVSLTFAARRPPTPDEIAFVDAVATQIAAAMENARLLAAAQQQTRRAHLLAELAAFLGRSLDPSTVLTTLVRQTADALEGCAAVYLARDGEETLGVAAVHHPDPTVLARIEQGLRQHPPRPGVGVFGQAYAQERTLLVRFDDSTLPEEMLVYARRLGATSSIGVPLLAGGRRLGVLSISSLAPCQPYTEDDRILAAAIGALAAQALDNARAYAAAEAERARLAATFASMVDAVYLVDTQGQAMTLNAAALQQIGAASPDEVSAGAIASLGLREQRSSDGRPLSPEESPVRRAVRGETIAGFEVAGADATGAERYLLVNAAPVRTEEGTVVGAVVVVHDVTALRAAERAKDEFLSVASHELRTPLTPIKGYLQLIKATLDRADAGAPLDIARLRRQIGTMGDRVERLTALVDEMLDVSRLQTGRLTLHLEQVDLSALARAVVDGYAVHQHLAGSGRKYLALRAPEPVVVRCDPLRIEQVVGNLIANALRYAPPGGHVWVTVERAGDEAIVRVEDDGIGIPAGEEGAVFGPFVQGSNAPAGQYGGFGLGLYISREIVMRHGGSITAGPRDPGAAAPGAAFRVRLPLAGPPTEPPGSAADPPC